MRTALILILLLALKCAAQSNPSAAPTLIESVMVNGQPVTLSDRSPSVKVRARLDKLEILYAADGLTAPREGPFRYRLNGRDAVWHVAGTNRLARFSNLLPGRYMFMVQSAKPGGAWDDNGATLLVTVSPGLGFKLLGSLAVSVALLLGGSVYFLMYRRKQANKLMA